MIDKLTPSNCDIQIRQMVDKYHIYGAECLVNALVRASLNQPYLDGNAMMKLFQYAYERERKEVEHEPT